jgi:hypothetical protein
MLHFANRQRLTVAWSNGTFASGLNGLQQNGATLDATVIASATREAASGPIH